jgi:hypothetical protein
MKLLEIVGLPGGSREKYERTKHQGREWYEKRRLALRNLWDSFNSGLSSKEELYTGATDLDFSVEVMDNGRLYVRDRFTGIQTSLEPKRM